MIIGIKNTRYILFIGIIVKTTLDSCKPLSIPYEKYFTLFVKMAQFEHSQIQH
jgi:hypothetical protein